MVGSQRTSSLAVESFSTVSGSVDMADMAAVQPMPQKSSMPDDPPGYPGQPGHPTQQPPRRAFQEPVPAQDSGKHDTGAVNGCMESFIVILCRVIILLLFPLTVWFSIRIVKEYERAVIFRLGRALPGAKGPGMFFIIPCIDELVKLDLRTISFDVPPQEILTRDSVTVAVDAVVYYKIYNPYIAVCNVENASMSTRLLSATTLRNFLGTKTLSEILTEREDISGSMQTFLDEGTDPWGVKVERVEIKDVRLPFQLQRAMATEAEATREARAKFVAAEGEMRASEALKNAANILAESPSALQLRYLQTLTTISAEKNSTIIFPLPMDMLQIALNIKQPPKFDA